MTRHLIHMLTLLNLSDAADHAALLRENTRLQEKAQAEHLRLQEEQISKAAPFIEVMATFPNGDRRRLIKKPDVKTLRMYAEHSPWVRAAIDIYRQAVGRAEYKLVPIDKKRKVNAAVERRVHDLLDNPNPIGETWTQIKEKAIEDHLVVSFGPIEKKLRNDASPYELYCLDAGNFGFFQGWNGSQPKLPRYAITNAMGGIERPLANAMAMVPINRQRSYTEMGLSHVETLHKTVMLLLAGDDFFLEQALDPSAQGVLNLGPGYKKQQIDQMRAEMHEVRKLFAIVSGPQKMDYVNFRLTEEKLKLLDTQTFYIRQVAAIFGISTAKLRLAVDTSRANTQQMFDDDLEGPASLLSRWQQMENKELVGAFGTPQETNLQIVYPILSHRDEERQAKITKTQIGGAAWVAINQAREDTGSEAIDLPIANQPLVDTPSGPVPLEYLNAKFYDEKGKLKPIPELPEIDPNNPDDGNSNADEFTPGKGKKPATKPADDKKGKVTEKE